MRILMLMLAMMAAAGAAEFRTILHCEGGCDFNALRFFLPPGGGVKVVGGAARFEALHVNAEGKITEYIIIGEVAVGDVLVGYDGFMVSRSLVNGPSPPGFVTVKIMSAEELGGETVTPDFDVVVEASGDGKEWSVLGTWGVKIGGEKARFFRSRLVKRPR